MNALWNALNDSSRFATPQSTIDAVMYSLRGGTAVLARDDVRHRLAAIDESRLREMIVLLQKRDGRIAPRWSDDDIGKLLETWTRVVDEQQVTAKLAELRAKRTVLFHLRVKRRYRDA